MSRQIQIRRGNSTQHTAFIGAIGEITVDTDKNTLCVHDGRTNGGTALARVQDIAEMADSINELLSMMDGMDFVIETFRDNNIWWRKYKSGWVEQGGTVNRSGAGHFQINLPIEMADMNYYANSTIWSMAAASGNDCSPGTGRLSTRAITHYASRTTYTNPVMWEVKGMSAPASPND